MTPKEVVEHFDNSIEFAAYNLGFSGNAVKNWVKQNKVPLKTQLLIQAITGGKLTADEVPMPHAKS